MSQENPINCQLQPKKFLKKGEGLKRFAAYKPPLPVSANKVKRRQTFVKFTLDEKPFKRDNGSNYLPPEILYNDSINLSTEIPKIAPPKIMHTPIRPNRQALGALGASAFNRGSYDDLSSDSEPIHNPYRPQSFRNFTPIKSKFDQPRNKVGSTETSKVTDSLQDRNLTRKVVTLQPNPLNKKISFSGFRKPPTPSPITTPHTPVAQKIIDKPLKQAKSDEPETTAPKRYNLRGSRKPNSESTSVDTKGTKTRTDPKPEPKRTRRQLKAVVERHISPLHKADEDEEPCITDSQINGNIDMLMKKIEERKKSDLMCDESDEVEAGDIDDKVSEHGDCEKLRETPVTSGVASHRMNYNQAFDLSSPSPGSCILALGQQIQHIESTVNILKDSIRNCECGAYLSNAQQPQINRTTRKTTRTRASEKTRPSANADNSTHKILTSLMNDVAQLKAKFDEIDLRR